MTYRPQGRQAFGPPARTWIMPGVYLAAAIAFVGVVVGAHLQTSGWLFEYIVERDPHRIIGARVLAGLVLLGGVASVVRTAMRGVVVHPDGVEFRDVVNLGWPKIKNFTWAEIDQVVFERNAVALRTWDGDRCWLPAVLDDYGLKRTLERVAVARGIPLTGDGLRPVEEVEAEIEEQGADGSV